MEINIKGIHFISSPCFHSKNTILTFVIQFSFEIHTVPHTAVIFFTQRPSCCCIALFSPWNRNHEMSRAVVFFFFFLPSSSLQHKENDIWSQQGQLYYRRPEQRIIALSVLLFFCTIYIAGVFYYCENSLCKIETSQTL